MQLGFYVSLFATWILCNAYKLQGTAVREDGQILLDSKSEIQIHKIAKLPIEEQKGPFTVLHRVNIAIGTPPQNFTAVLDTAHNGPLVVPGTGCLDDLHCQGRAIYNASCSRTYHDDGRPYETDWYGMSYDGYLSCDDVALGEIRIESSLFEEWESATCVSIGCASNGYGAVVGLAPPWLNASIAPHPLKALFDGDLLDQAVFSLMLPSHYEDEGQLTLGANNPPASAETAVVLPVLDEVDDFSFKNMWPLNFTRLSFRNGSEEFTVPFNNYRAVVVSSFPGVMLPADWGTTLNSIIGTVLDRPPIPRLDCDLRETLPFLTLSFGDDDQNLTISGYDYIQDYSMFSPGEKPLCLSMLNDAQDYGVGGDVIVLGSAFLGAFHTAFDLEERTLGFSRLRYDSAN